MAKYPAKDNSGCDSAQKKFGAKTGASFGGGVGPMKIKSPVKKSGKGS